MRKCALIFICFALLFSLCLFATPVKSNALELGYELPMPSNIELEIHDTCWGHDWFQMYYVREDGWFVVFSIVGNLHGADKQGYERAYVDIYDAEGAFIKELAFNNFDPDIIAILTESAVEIYMPGGYLSYHLETEEATWHYTPANYVQNSGLSDLQWQTKMQVGEWMYKSNGPFQMCHILTREKDGYKETVLKLRGSGLSFPQVIPSVIVSMVVILAGVWFTRKNRKKSTAPHV